MICGVMLYLLEIKFPNRISDKKMDKSPYEAWIGKIDSYKKVKV